MKRLSMILLPVLLASMTMGLIAYRGETSAEEIGVDSGNAATNAYSVPADIYYTKYVDTVVFSHQTHVADVGLQCNGCHSGTFQQKAKTVEARTDFNMQGLNSGKYCGSCHSSTSNVAFAADTQCARCHRGVKGLEGVEESGGGPAEGSSQDQYQDSVKDQYQRGG